MALYSPPWTIKAAPGFDQPPTMSFPELCGLSMIRSLGPSATTLNSSKLGSNGIARLPKKDPSRHASRRSSASGLLS